MWEKNKEKDIDELAMKPRTAVGCRQNHPYTIHASQIVQCIFMYGPIWSIFTTVG